MSIVIVTDPICCSWIEHSIDGHTNPRRSHRNGAGCRCCDEALWTTVCAVVYGHLEGAVRERRISVSDIHPHLGGCATIGCIHISHLHAVVITTVRYPTWCGVTHCVLGITAIIDSCSCCNSSSRTSCCLVLYNSRMKKLISINISDTDRISGGILSEFSHVPLYMHHSIVCRGLVVQEAKGSLRELISIGETFNKVKVG